MASKSMILGLYWGIILNACGVDITEKPLEFFVLLFSAIVTKDFDKIYKRFKGSKNART